MGFPFPLTLNFDTGGSVITNNMENILALEEERRIYLPPVKRQK